jgi:acetylornithine deacetylase/succinyl-diaminopimelate desuccinylase-like protein
MCREDLVAFTRTLANTPSPSFREEAVAGLVQDLLEELRYDLVFRDEVGNVIGFLTGSEEGPTVLLSTPMDTTRPDPVLRKSADPQLARSGPEHATGHGSIGCKAGLAAQIYAGKALDKSLVSLYGTIVFAATVAQEEGNGAGVRHLLEETLPKIGVTPDLAILGEPTALHVCNGHDGWADVDIHVVSPNAGTAERTIRSIRDTLASASARASWARKTSSIDVSEPAMSGGSDSIQATLRVRCRVRSGEAVTNCVGAVKRMVLSVVETLGEASVDVHVHTERRRFYSGRAVEVLCWNNPWMTDMANPLSRRALEALAAAGWPDPTARSLGLENLEVSTAGSLLADGYHIPTLCFGPGDTGRADVPDGFVAAENLVDAVFGTAVLVYGAIGAPISLVWPTRRAPRDPGQVSMTGGGR